MSESKHTPETALALAGVAIFDRGIGWQADATATLKALAAEVERLREERDASEKMMRAAYENACAHRAAAAERFAAERRKVEALEAEIALRRKSGSAVDRLHNLCEGIAESADGSEWSREEWERIDAENAALRRKVEALREALTMLHAICRDCDLETEATRPTEEQYIAAMDAAEAALASTEGGA